MNTEPDIRFHDPARFKLELSSAPVVHAQVSDQLAVCVCVGTDIAEKQSVSPGWILVDSDVVDFRFAHPDGIS